MVPAEFDLIVLGSGAAAYIDGGIAMVRFLKERTPVQFSVVPDFP